MCSNVSTDALEQGNTPHITYIVLCFICRRIEEDSKLKSDNIL